MIGEMPRFTLVQKVKRESADIEPIQKTIALFLIKAREQRIQLSQSHQLETCAFQIRCERWVSHTDDSSPSVNESDLGGEELTIMRRLGDKTSDFRN